MDIKLPSGVFTPDSGSDGGPGCLLALLAGLIVIASAANSCSTSGAGEPTRLNYLTHDTLCAPRAQAFAEYEQLERQSFDAGEPQSRDTSLRIARSVGATILQAGTEVSVERSEGVNSLVTPQSQGARPCLVNSGRLRMGWKEWVFWKWGQRQAAEQQARKQSAQAEAFRLRWSTTQPIVVACLTGVHAVRYTGVGLERATAVDLSRCHARGGQVSFSGPPDGVVFYSDGTSATNFSRPDLAFMLAGPPGTQAVMSCSCGQAPPTPRAAEPMTPTAGPTVEGAIQVLSEAERAFESRDYVGALRLCDQALALDPGNPQGQALRARVLKTQEILARQ